MPSPAEQTLRLRTSSSRERDARRLGGLHPALATYMMRILDAMEVLGFPMFVTYGIRSDEEQAALYAKGRTAPGKIVTNVDGRLKKSMHQLQLDGWGHAVDCAFIDDPETEKIETWDPLQPWDVYGTMGEAYGLTWGGRWRTLVDRPHLELSLNWKELRP